MSHRFMLHFGRVHKRIPSTICDYMEVECKDIERVADIPEVRIAICRNFGKKICLMIHDLDEHNFLEVLFEKERAFSEGNPTDLVDFEYKILVPSCKQLSN